MFGVDLDEWSFTVFLVLYHVVKARKKKFDDAGVVCHLCTQRECTVCRMDNDMVGVLFVIEMNAPIVGVVSGARS